MYDVCVIYFSPLPKRWWTLDTFILPIYLQILIVHSLTMINNFAIFLHLAVS